MSVRPVLSWFIAFAALAVSQGAFAQTPSPKAAKTPKGATPTPSPSPTPEVFATPEATPEMTPEPTPEPMPTPEPIPEEGPNAGKPTSAVVHGFVIGRFDSTDGKGLARKSGSGFSVQNARIILAGDVHESVDYLTAIEPLLSTGPLQEAWVRWKPAGFKLGPAEKWRLQAGQFRKPLGWEGRISEAALETMEYSMTTQFLMGPSNYDVGVGAGTSFGENVHLDLAVVNGTGPFNVLTTTPTTVGAQDPLEHKDVVGRLGLDLMGGRLQTGMSAAGGHALDPLYGIPSVSPGLPPTIIPVFYWRAAYDVVGNFGPIFVASEGVYGKSTFKLAPTGLGPTPGGPTATGASAYLLFGYRVGNFLPNFRVEYIDPTIGEDDTDSAEIENVEVPRDWANAVSLGVNWMPVKRVKFRAQYELVSGNAPITLASPAQAYLPATARPGYGKDMSGTFSASLQADF